MVAKPNVAEAPNIVLVASTVGWLLGGLTLLVGLAVVIPSIVMRQNILQSLLFPLVGTGYCISAYRLRRQRISGAVIGMAISGIFLLLIVIGPRTLSAASIVQILFFALCAFAYQRLSKDASARSTADV
jgi:hypothetical protein